MIKRLELRNFTSFSKLNIDFSPKINVIIGENGTGKTQLLKAAYGLCAGAPLFKTQPDIIKEELGAALTSKLLRLFMPLDDKLGKLHRQGATDQAYLSAHFAEGQQIALTFFNNSNALAIQDRTNYEQYQAEAVFIPTKEVLSLARGMTDQAHDQRTIELIFDDGYIDLAQKLIKPIPKDIDNRINQNPRLNTIIPTLVDLIGGRYQWQEEGFCFQPGTYIERPSPQRTAAKAAKMYQDSMITVFVPNSNHTYSSGMTAEGFRKIGTIHQLLSNGAIFPGVSGPLFWDEPESNMNPKLMKRIVQTLIELSRNGQQIILATHDYVLLKWFDLLLDKEKGDHITFHALSQENGEVSIESSSDYKQLNTNAIANTFSELYDEEIKRSFGGIK